MLLSTCGFYGTIYGYWKPKVCCNKSELRPLDTVSLLNRKHNGMYARTRAPRATVVNRTRRYS
jgi:hypothetical protein